MAARWPRGGGEVAARWLMKRYPERGLLGWPRGGGEVAARWPRGGVEVAASIMARIMARIMGRIMARIMAGNRNSSRDKPLYPGISSPGGTSRDIMARVVAARVDTSVGTASKSEKIEKSEKN